MLYGISRTVTVSVYDCRLSLGVASRTGTWVEVYLL